MKGKIKFFNMEKHFGFISGDDEKDYFVHISEMPKGITEIKEGDRVSFDAAKNDKGLIAKKVTLEV